ncbi:hypothetical protein JRQ81_008856 [Phrynocephalus forsythii]|uniref:TIR domain-containing adapter molecule 1 n=1 Tax=Phrynocephalus forsythii TaxID=171643 RepID=A0A9Q0XBR4_9SAUR|nr:hypothetical protein JRQ81_008856 [Phrynocephalus forsythii]
MAKKAGAPPDVEGIFEILRQIPQERLVWYKHKLNCARGDQRTCQLLRGIVLLTLKEEAEARVNLDALGYDLVVAHIYRSHWGPAKVGLPKWAPDKPDAEVALAVARIYALLAEEEFCPPQDRDEAYRAVVRAFRESQVDAARLESLVDEARAKCGMGLLSALPGNHLGLFAADAGGSPTQRSLEPRSLRSTGTPLSFVSRFEISPTTTVAWVSGSDHERDPEAGEVGGSTSDPPGPAGQEDAGLQSPSNAPLQDAGASEICPPRWPGPDRPPATRPAEGEVRHPPHSTPPLNGAEKELQAPEDVPQNPDTSTPQSTSSNPAGWSPKLTESPFPPTSKEEVEPQGSPSSASPPEPGDANQFFSFVVLHAAEDEEVAYRVKSLLEDLGIPDGATYSDDFLIPGRCQLGCFQDALDNSAFTLLLLTQNFQNDFCAYQTSVALTESFRRLCRRHTVIPFVPKENPMPKREMPSVLAALVPLEEASPVFRRRVAKTFAPQAIREKKDAWRQRRQVQELQRQQEAEREEEEMRQRLSELRTGVRLPAPRPGFPPPRFSTPFPAPGLGQLPTGPDHPSLSQPFLVSLGSGGPPPQLIIQNAQMIQIGDYNRMQAEEANLTLGPTDRGH